MIRGEVTPAMVNVMEIAWPTVDETPRRRLDRVTDR